MIFGGHWELRPLIQSALNAVEAFGPRSGQRQPRFHKAHAIPLLSKVHYYRSNEPLLI